MAGLKLGWAPTLIGYSLQGLFKFGLYEFFKGTFSIFIQILTKGMVMITQKILKLANF